MTQRETQPRHSEREMERFHLLSTIVAYPDLSTRDVRDRANEECQHERFDPLPFIDGRAVAAKLGAMARAGLIESWDDGIDRRWQATDAGRQAWIKYELGLGEAKSATP